MKIKKKSETQKKGEAEMYVVGLDLSVNCSGCCIFDVQHKVWYMSAFAVNLKQVGTWKINEHVNLSLFPPVPSTHMKDMERYLFIEKNLMQEMDKRIPHEMREQSLIVIEDYCLKSSQKKTAVKLHESAACIKRALTVSGFNNITLVLNQTWKSVVHCKSKIDTVRYIHAHGPQFDLLSWFGKQESELTTTKNKYSGKTTVNVPSPIQDLADAVALAMFGGMSDEERKAAKKQKKAKIVIELSPIVKQQLQELKEHTKRVRQTSQWTDTDPPKKKAKKKKDCLSPQKKTTTKRENQIENIILSDKTQVQREQHEQRSVEC